jgi:hypothetical protein
MKSSWGIAVVTAAVLSSVAGCAGGDVVGSVPTATATATVTAGAEPPSTATPEPTPVDELAAVDTIVVSAAGLSLRQGESELASLDVVAVPLDDAVALLARVLGEPRADGLEGSHCRPAQTRWGWGTATHIGTPDLYTDEGTLTFTARDAAIETPDGRSVRIETTGGLAVGDPIAPLDAATDATVKDDFSVEPGRDLGIVYDLDRTTQISGDEWSPHGASVHSTDGAIEVIRSTSTLKDFC